MQRFHLLPQLLRPVGYSLATDANALTSITLSGALAAAEGSIAPSTPSGLWQPQQRGISSAARMHTHRRGCSCVSCATHAPARGCTCAYCVSRTTMWVPIQHQQLRSVGCCPGVGGALPPKVVIEYDPEDVDAFISAADAIEAAFPTIAVDGNEAGPGSFEVTTPDGVVIYSKLSANKHPDPQHLVAILQQQQAAADGECATSSAAASASG